MSIGIRVGRKGWNLKVCRASLEIDFKDEGVAILTPELPPHIEKEEEDLRVTVCDGWVYTGTPLRPIVYMGSIGSLGNGINIRSIR